MHDPRRTGQRALTGLAAALALVLLGAPARAQADSADLPLSGVWVTTSSEGDADAWPDGEVEPAARRPHADGDLDYPAEPEPMIDGAAEAPEPEPLEDGDPTADARSPEDIAVFGTPPAGYDPLLFQVEDIEPVLTDRRPARLYRFEPYDPVGIRIASFVLFPQVELGGLATGNALSPSRPEGDVAAEVRSEVRLVSDWSAHALELRGTTASSFHDDFPSEDDRAWDLEARGRLDFSRRTNLQVLAARDVRQESRSAIDASAAGERPDVTTDELAAAFRHRFNRLTLDLKGSVSETRFSDTHDGLAVVSNADRDVKETGEALRATWQFKPARALFAEAGLNQRRYDVAAFSDGIRRDSDGERYRLGLDFGATSRILRGEISLGFGRQTPDDARLGAVSGVLIDANLAWKVTGLTSLLFTARSDIYDTTTAGSGGVVGRRLGVEVRHALRRYVIASAGLACTDYDYDASPIAESELVTAVGAEYFASRDVILFARYQHVAFESTEPASDYHSDEIRLGVRLRR